MPEPIVFISRSRIAEGKLEAFASAYRSAVRLIADTKRRTAVFAAYLDESGEEVSIVHVFPDAAAMLAHFEGSDERSASVAELITLIGFEVFGPAPEVAVEMLRREAAANGFPIVVRRESIAGFVRPSA
jgi:hypothetical protein